jgi:hypothetical protein
MVRLSLRYFVRSLLDIMRQKQLPTLRRTHKIQRDGADFPVPVKAA